MYKNVYNPITKMCDSTMNNHLTDDERYNQLASIIISLIYI